jgi:hypothetical protein
MPRRAMRASVVQSSRNASAIDIVRPARSGETPIAKIRWSDVARLTFRQNPACFIEDFLDTRLHELRGSNRSGNRAGVHPKGTEADKSCGKVGGAPAAEGVKHDITCPGSPLQDVERKV